MESVCPAAVHRKVPLQLFEEPGQQQVKSPDVSLKGGQYAGLAHWWLCDMEPTTSSHSQEFSILHPRAARASGGPASLPQPCDDPVPQLLMLIPQNQSPVLPAIKAQAFTKAWCLKLYDRAIGSCLFFSPQKPFSHQKLVPCESTYALMSRQPLASSSSCWKDLTSLVGPVTAHRPWHPYGVLSWSFLTHPPHPLSKKRPFIFLTCFWWCVPGEIKFTYKSMPGEREAVVEG